VAGACDYFAISSLSLPVASVLIYTSPVWAAFIAFIFLNEPLSFQHLLAAVSCMGGVLIVQPCHYSAGSSSAATGPELWPCFVAVLGAVLNASAFCTIRAIGDRVSGVQIVQAYLVACSVFSPFLMLLTSEPWVPPHANELLNFVGIGVFGAVAQITMTWSFQLEKAGFAAVFRYMEVVFAFIFGRWVLHEPTDRYSVGGAALVVLACSLVALHNASAAEPAGKDVAGVSGSTKGSAVATAPDQEPGATGWGW
jgi:drug/metabolite transporter (DMT)-like permease